MNTGLKVTLWVAGGLAVGTVAFFGIRALMKPQEDDNLTLDIGTVDWTQRLVPYTLKQGKQTVTSGNALWQMPGTSTFGNKVKVEVTKLTNGLVIQASHNGEVKSGKTI